MDKLSSQLILGLTLHDDATFENYFLGDNAVVVDALKNVVLGNGESFIYLWGSEGVGRSHLLQACCHEMPENKTALYFDLNEYEKFSTDFLEGLDHVDLVCFDNINAVINRPDWEESLFHFYNRAREHGKRLIVSSSMLPSQLPCHLDDLKSRLAWGLTFKVRPLNDSEKLLALCMRAKNRGLILPESAAQYLLHHMSRNLSELFRILDVLEKASLVEQRRITIPFIKMVVGDREK